jgi:glycosyltransferase involved in cell wall biosynthesis
MDQHEIISGSRLKKKLLLVTPCISPVPYAVSFVVKNFLGEFAPDEFVVAAERWPENPATQTETESGHPVEFISQRWTWPKRGQRYVHWAKWLTLGGVKRRLLDMIRRHDCGGILCMFPNEQLLYASYRASVKTGLPLFPHFHNVYRENRHGMGKRIADYLQPRVFAQSKIVFVMSSGMQRGWERVYPAVKFVPLTHSNCDPVPDYAPAPEWSANKIRLGFLGSINDSNLDALGRIRELIRTSPDVELNIYSNAKSWFLDKVGLSGERVTASSPSDEELISKLQTNDVLVLPHGFEGGLAPIEYETIFPTRTVPYLLSLRPILAHSPGHSFLNHWLREHDCAEIVDVKDVSALRAKLEWLRQNPGRREELVRNALRAVRQFDAAAVARHFRLQVNPVLESAL